MFRNINKSNKDKNVKSNKFDFITKDYKMAAGFYCNHLMIGKLEYVSSKVTGFGPQCKTSDIYYIFERIVVDYEIKYREVFTGFVASVDPRNFDLPYVVNINKVISILPEYENLIVPRLGMLELLNEVNVAMTNKEKVNDKVLNKKKD